MLLLLSAGLLIGSAFTLMVRRNRESALLAALCLCLTVYLLGPRLAMKIAASRTMRIRF